MNGKVMKACESYTCKKDHASHLRTDAIELVLVRGGKNAYLWIGKPVDEDAGTGGDLYGTIEGPAALQAFAATILEELASTKRRTTSAPTKEEP